MNRRFFIVLAILVGLLALIGVFWRPGGGQPLTSVQLPEIKALYTLPDATSAPFLDAINTAQSSVWLVVYQITDPVFTDTLRAATGRGVDVRVMLELNPYGGSSGNVPIFEDLKKAGVKTAWGNRAYQYTHQKAMLVDGKRLWIMTGNLTSSAFSANREYMVVTEDKAAIQEVARVFEADWQRTDPGLKADSRLIWSPTNSRARTLALLGSAKKSIWATHQNVQDVDIQQALIAAAKRGVDVRYIGSPRYPLDADTDEPGRDFVRKGGVQVRYMGDPYIHAKVFVIDGEIGVVGSLNWTTNSIDNNREVAIAFRTPAAVKKMVERFEADWKLATTVAFPVEEAAPASGIIAAKDAKRFYYQNLKVEFTVTHIYNSGRVIWLMPDADQDQNFKAVIFPSNYSKFADVPDKLYIGKTIRVKGLIEKYQGWPEIIVNGPEQVEVINK